MTDPYLAAFCINATSYERAEIRFAVVYEDEDGDWIDALGHHITPFWVEPLDGLGRSSDYGFMPDAISIPDGWIGHLQELAAKYAATHLPYAKPKIDISALVAKRSVPIRRRV